MIRLNDGKPWFRRWMWIGYKPITEEGRLIISTASGVFLLAAIIAILADGVSPWTELAFAVAISIVVAVTVIALYKMDDGF